MKSILVGIFLLGAGNSTKSLTGEREGDTKFLLSQRVQVCLKARVTLLVDLSILG